MILRISATILLLTVLGRAQSPGKDPRLATISDDRLRSLLTGMALDFTEDTTGDSTAFAYHLDGHLVRLVNQGKGLSLSACFEGEVDLLKGNQWDREHFSTRSYLDEKGCMSLRSEVTFGGGSTSQMIQDFISGFSTDVVVFARFLARPPAGPDTPEASQAAGTPSLERLASPVGAMDWSQLGPYTKRAPAWEPTGSTPGLLKIEPKVSLKYDPEEWKLETSHREGQFAFSHASGGAHALVIVERTAVPLDSVQDVVLANAQAIDPHAQLVFRNRPWVKGVAWWFLKMEATVGTVPMVYWGYYYVGEGGTIQVVAYTEKSRLPEYKQGFTDFLNGLTILR